MLNIKNIISIAALVCGLSIIFAAPQQALAQYIPPGSYQKTCGNKEISGATLKAVCDPKEKGGSWLGGPEFIVAKTTELANFFECEGDISNNNGDLQCQRNPNSALIQKAKAAIDKVYLEIYGSNTQQNSSVGAKIGGFLSGNSFNYSYYLGEMFKAGYAPEFYAGVLDKSVTNPILGNQPSKTARDFFYNYLNSPSRASDKAKVVDLAFTDVYGTGVSPKDLAFYNAQRIGYIDVVFNERKKMTSDKVLNRLAISYAYKKTMGRTQTPAETEYWIARPQIFKEIVDANRAFLYAPNGGKDLTETIKRHLLDKGIDKPSIEQINAAIIKFSNTKAIYEEMK